MITREADYALRMVLYLASVREKRVSVAELSEELDISYYFLRNIALRLVKTNVLSSHRGQQGGMELAREPSLISLLDVVRAVSEGSCRLNACLGGDSSCSRLPQCSIHNQLALLQKVLDRQLGVITFDQLL